MPMPDPPSDRPHLGWTLPDGREHDLFGPVPAPPGPAEVLEDPEQWERAMAEIADFSAVALREAGVAGPEARRLGCAVAIRLCRELGGTRYYWPRGSGLERAVRDLAIYAAHDGTVGGPRGVQALAREHGLTDVHIWRVLKRQRALHRRRARPP
jgi:Mor family transcriptional regulator